MKPIMINKDLTIIVLQRLWQAISGSLTLIFIVQYLSLNEQGWYYGYLSLSAIYTLFEMGLSSILVNISAKYFRDLSWGHKGVIVGLGREYFSDFINKSIIVYIKMAVVFFIFILISGFIFFEYGSKISNKTENYWYFIWFLLVFITALQMLIMPFLSIIEGSGKMVESYAVRLVQSFFGSVLCWYFLSNGYGLWATLSMPSLAFAVGIIWLLTMRIETLKSAFRRHLSSFNWHKVVWPLQWRFSLTWLSAYFLTQIYTPFIFAWHGAEAAGQFGLTLTMAHMVGIVVQSWMTRLAPAMVCAVQDKDWYQLDVLFKSGFMSMILLFFGAFLLLNGMHIALDFTHYINRVLEFWSFLFLFIAVFVYYIVGAMALHLRSFMQEPLMKVMIASAVLTFVTALPVLFYFDVNMMIGVIFSVQIIFNLPLSIFVWHRFYKKWRV